MEHIAAPVGAAQAPDADPAGFAVPAFEDARHMVPGFQGLAAGRAGWGLVAFYYKYVFPIVGNLVIRYNDHSWAVRFQKALGLRNPFCYLFLGEHVLSSITVFWKTIKEIRKKLDFWYFQFYLFAL